MLAEQKQVTIDYRVGLLESLNFQEEHFDAIALIYAHFPASIKSAYHKKLATLLRKGGIIIFEAFSKNHLACIENNESVGGPKDIDMLFSTEELQNDFSGFEVLALSEELITLSEGLYHNGTGSVIRFVGRKM